MRNILVLTLLLLFGGCSPGVSGHSDFIDAVQQRAVPIESDADLDRIAAAVPNSRLILIGESTHGTAEFYRKRAEITKRLIERGDISFVAVEGDWAALHRLNTHVKSDLAGEEQDLSVLLEQLTRWPQWMWANEEVKEFLVWLQAHNARLPHAQRIGFYGMDVYGQWESLDMLLLYLREHAGDHFSDLEEKAACFTTYGRNEWVYGRAAAAGRISCRQEIQDLVAYLDSAGEELASLDADAYFAALQNAYVVQNAEAYFRLAVQGGPEAWNSRVSHMNDTVNKLLARYGNDSRGVVWAHNTHVGDARATRMAEQGLVNIGTLSRKEQGRDQVYSIGFSTYTGRVMAGSSWGSPAMRMEVPRGMPGSLEAKLNATGLEKFYLLFDEDDRAPTGAFLKPLGHRAIGVVYNPRNEQGNYVPTVVPERYDMLIFIRETDTVTPLGD
ncbi:erythromycin esterase family protein [Desulfobulbus alkaliphilus]|uniref:erythromycin esterase family protein n=1 Tax=Desulfobulbus alkaliphilus TaxID=869814 RepID=UPI0019661F9D|nr:erythromycin esterase family protein [Desulfobulbus alkaliphilus]MBM9538246.1 erythromycin esterase family protein [Desulfobulbus alkaliphilus]